jgi:hypothetical protein
MAGKYDNMSFSKAFAAARKAEGSGKTFTWKGKSYSTNYKEESGSKKSTKTGLTSSPRPKIRPESKSEITVSALPSNDPSVKKIVARAEKAINAAEKGGETVTRVKKIVEDLKNERKDDPTTLVDNLKRWLGNWKSTGGISGRAKGDPRKMNKGGMAKKKSGYSKGGSVTDMRKTGLFK